MSYKQKYTEAIKVIKEKASHISDTETRMNYLQRIERNLAENENECDDPFLSEMLYQLELAHIEGMTSTVDNILKAEGYNTGKTH